MTVSALTAALGPGFVPLLAYIDPGMVSIIVQAFFVIVFGAVATTLLGPWRWLTSVFGRNRNATGTDAAENNPAAAGRETGTADAP